MSWKKYFTPVPTSNNVGGSYSPFSFKGGNTPGPAATNYSSHLPDVYVGSPNRIERYGQYNTMDMDTEINAALDILAEFCTQENKENGTPFKIKFTKSATNSEVTILAQYLKQWCKLQKFETRMFRIVRNIFKYGDQFFIRDPETKKWFHVDPANVTKIIVNESEGKKPEQYIVRDLNISFESLSATKLNTTNAQGAYPGTGGGNYGSFNQQPGTGRTPDGNSSRFASDANESAIDAEHMIHISLSEGLDQNYPFGNSLLETIFKVYKQKELLEDAIIIYRVQRAPERRVFYIDVGNMPTHLAMSFVERVKTEIHQRRIPSRTGGGATVIDSTYNPLCLDLETKIPLLDGRTLTLKKLIEEFNQGKENWTYSCNPITGEVVPGVINWAGVTRKNTEVIKLTFDNGKTLICTPDHKIPVFGKGFVEAKDIKSNDSLISFEKRFEKISNKSSEYEQVWDHSSKTWKWTHRLVGEFFRKINKHQEFTFLEENKGKEKTVIHHKDYNRFNNDPRNLQYMNKTDHILYHASLKEDYWKNLSASEKEHLSNKISKTLKEYWEGMSKLERQSALYRIRQAQKRAVWMRKNDPITISNYSKNQSISRKKYINTNLEFKEMLIRNLENRVKIKNQELNLTFEMLQIVVDIVKNNSTNKNRVIELCDKNQELLELVKKENSTTLDYKNAQCKIDFFKFGYSKLNRLLTKYGYKNWKHFVKNIEQFNHKVVKIEKIANRDTGTITIDGNEKWHDYHTFAIDSGIFVKNSINEDYFFPQTAEGRGSKVDTLPGGTNLGEIDDLRYFTNKLLRGLRIPSSYLPTGAEEANSQYNDGRVGTAYIQELRFNNYCERLQRLITEKFNNEFKLYLQNKGINIDITMFDLEFQAPQNFASYRQAELDGNRISTFTAMSAVPYISNRFALQRFLGLSKEEIAENEKMWREENDDGFAGGEQDPSSQMRDAGVGSSDISGDLDNIEDEATDDELTGGSDDPSPLGSTTPQLDTKI